MSDVFFFDEPKPSRDAEIGGERGMIEPRRGVWWAETNPNRPVPGTLSRDGDRWVLDLIGTLWVDRGGPDGLALVPSVTIFGSCLGTRYTLRRAFYDGSKLPDIGHSEPNELDRADHQNLERWSGYSLLQGGALGEETLYEAARFELTGLSEWWPRTGLRGEVAPNRGSEYRSPTPTEADCGDGLLITIGANITESSRMRRRVLQEHVRVWADKESGFTLQDLTVNVIIPLRALVSVCLHHRVREFNVALRPVNTVVDHEAWKKFTYPISVEPDVVDAETEAEALPIRKRSPALTAGAVDPETVIPNWLRFGAVHPIPLFVAEYGDDGPLQTEVAQAVNAAETLHRALHPDSTDLPFTAKVRAALSSAGGLNSDERRRVVNAVKFTELTLEERLLQLAQGLGDEFCGWFFDGQASNWAHVAATIRNALSHGYPTTHKLEEDTGALVGVARITRAVIQLRLLVHAGVKPDGALVLRISKDGEYLALVRQRVADWANLAEATRSWRVGRWVFVGPDV